MNNYYSPSLSQDNMQDQRSNQRHRSAGNITMLNTSGPASGSGSVLPGPLSAGSDMGMPGADSLDDMIHPGHGMHRRGSLAQQYAGQADQGSPDRRMSMMDFGNPNNFQGFQYGSMTGGFDGMGNDMNMPSHTTAYGQPAVMSLSDANGYPISPSMGGMMDEMMGFHNLNVGLQGDPNALFFPSPTMGSYPPTTLDSVNTDFSMDMGVDDGPLSASSANHVAGMVSKHDDSVMAGMDDNTLRLNESHNPMTHNGNLNQSGHHLFQPNLRATLPQNEVVIDTFQSPSTMRAISHVGASVPPSTPMTPATSAPTPGPLAAPTSKGTSTVYSKTGFDMLKALMHVASRPNPVIDIGAVDLSCAFVVCDAQLNDCPIIYVSENFQNLTGYNRHEILGKNCRFLQAPDGNVEAGKKREFVAGDAVQNLKDAIAQGQEIQQSLINYRKGGKPFLNLLTMIPIPWDSDEIRYFVGFQIDLVERPDAISGVESSGAMQVSYNRSEMDKYVWDAPDPSAWNPESGQTLGIDDVSSLLQSFNPKGATSDWHKQSWDKMLLENADDVIHVLTLKGVFLYLSPACKKVLQYETHELVGQNISAICHPSDLVSLQRDIKDAPHNKAVNFIFRVMRKYNGYTWFEGYGSLYSEQGKGRKCLIMVGRKRPVTVLRRSELEANGGFSETEMWSKVSTSGMFLFVGGNPMKMIDYDKASLVGTSMQDLMRKDTRMEFGRAIERARKGHVVTCKHELFNKKGTAIQACTTFYPGDTPTGMKPSFLIAQTRLVRAHSRAIAPAPPRPLGAPGAPVTSEDPGRTPRAMATPVSRTTEETGIVVHTPTITDKTIDPHDVALADPDNLFDELRTTRGTSWYYELRHMEKVNRHLSEELAAATNNRKKRKRRKAGNMVRDCANCHTRNTPEWRRGPSGNRDLCNSCGLRWAKSNGRISPRNSRGGSGDTVSKKSNSPIHSSPLHREVSSADTPALEQTNNGKTPATSTDEEVTTPTPPLPLSLSLGTVGNGTVQQPKSIDEVVTGHAHNHGYNPPQSTPMLEGGSGLGGGGMEMTAIQEERETSA